MVLPWLIAIVAAQRLAELQYARRNARALLARGAVEIAPEQHRYFAALHAAWLIAMLLFVPWNAPPNWALVGVFFILQLLRIWIIASLGAFWTTRIITLPGAPLVRRGPYRVLRHPNYAVVVLEIAILPLAFSAYPIAAIFTVLNALLLAWRINAEEHALAPRRDLE